MARGDPQIINDMAQRSVGLDRCNNITTATTTTATTTTTTTKNKTTGLGRQHRKIQSKNVSEIVRHSSRLMLVFTRISSRNQIFIQSFIYSLVSLFIHQLV